MKTNIISSIHMHTEQTAVLYKREGGRESGKQTDSQADTDTDINRCVEKKKKIKERREKEK